jgi:hypothetical protein
MVTEFTFNITAGSQPALEAVMVAIPRHSKVFVYRSRSIAHIIERVGLAMIGIACGLFVAALVAQTGDGQFAFFTMFAVAIGGGAIGFYSGVDIPPHTLILGDLDSAELLGATGTFLAALAALVSVYMIVDDVRPGLTWTYIDGACWLIGISMQILSGIVSRVREV